MRVLYVLVSGRVHNDVVKEIETHLHQDRSSLAVVITGVSLAGKKIVCQRAAGTANFVPYKHLCDASFGFVQLARTIATWFTYVEIEEVRKLAIDVLFHISKNHWSKAHDLCIDLVGLSIDKGLRSCFLIDRIQVLDEFSLSLLRECLFQNDPQYVRKLSQSRFKKSRSESFGVDMVEGKAKGKICFLCIHTNLYNGKSVSDVVEYITRSNNRLEVPVIRLGEAQKEELRTMVRLDQIYLYTTFVHGILFNLTPPSFSFVICQIWK